jgi:demethoxyubiquinone hydroxylase (CLK1/Coq7/Cat5 family)
MKKDEFTKRVTSRLDQLAKEQHHNKMLVMNHVLDSVQKKPSSFYNIWKMSGFAFAAAIMGIVVLPGSLQLADKPQNQVIANPKLSPQMVEDMEMLLVLGEDKVQHGS